MPDQRLNFFFGLALWQIYLAESFFSATSAHTVNCKLKFSVAMTINQEITNYFMVLFDSEDTWS